MNRKINILILLSFLFVVVLGAAFSYSKYVSEVSGEINSDIADWKITVNGCNIVNPDTSNEECFVGTEQEDGSYLVERNFGISDITYYGNTDNISSNKIAPGYSGSFSINILPNGTEVSFEYTIYIEKPSNSSITISLCTNSDCSTFEDLDVDENYYTYTNKLIYSSDSFDSGENVTLYVNWENNEDNNEEDTKIGIDGSESNLDIPVSIVFNQYKG